MSFHTCIELYVQVSGLLQKCRQSCSFLINLCWTSLLTLLTESTAMIIIENGISCYEYAWLKVIHLPGTHRGESEVCLKFRCVQHQKSLDGIQESCIFWPATESTLGGETKHLLTPELIRADTVITHLPHHLSVRLCYDSIFHYM